MNEIQCFWVGKGVGRYIYELLRGAKKLSPKVQKLSPKVQMGRTSARGSNRLGPT